jgi:membrane-associated phospholipid phosphatase
MISLKNRFLTSSKINLKYLVAFIMCYFVMFVNGQNKTLETSGDVLFVALPTTAVITTFLNKDNKGRKEFAKGFVTNIAITLALKEIVKKPRPDLSDTKSFPSGHTSTAFQSASFLQKRYGWKYGVPAYLLAGFTGFTRINADKHDGWDVLVGAAIGIGSTYIFTTPYQQKHMKLTYSSNNKNQHLIGYAFIF